MRIVGIIPARFHSTRFPGKALADLEGRPLICHVCEAAAESGILDQVCVATDSEEIAESCRQRGFSVQMTSSSHQTPTARVKEAADHLPADLYVMIGGDEPLVTPADIRLVVDSAVPLFQRSPGKEGPSGFPAPFAVNALGVIQEAAEALDPANIKVAVSESGEGLYASRGPIPYPKGTLDFRYKKFVSIGVYPKESLDFFVSTPPGGLELTEECDLLRFIEHRKPVLFTEIPTRTLSVDTPKDLARVKELLRARQVLHTET